MFKLAFVATVAVAAANPIKKVYKAPTKSCPKGYSLEGKQCVSRHFEDEVLECDAGVLVGEWCESSSPAFKACPAGWTLNGKSCSMTSSVPAEAVCYNGYTLEGDVCVTWTEVDLVPTCSHGILSGNSCLVDEEVPAEYTCDAEYQKGKCFRSETYECPAKKSTYGRWLRAKKAYTHATQWYTSKKAPVYTKKAPLPAPKSHCTRRVDVAMTATCLADFTLSGNTCSRTVAHAADYICPVGGDSKGCYERTETAAAHQCPAGYTQSKNGWIVEAKIGSQRHF
eukprot:Selendium_serpulae@DN5886_c0_g1_i3.p1